MTFALLFAALGSIVLPLKALVMNVLSISAAFGVMVWGFQDGHLAGLLDFTSTGTVEASQPMLILAMAFGLSMDYELFLLSRIREEYQRTGDNAGAVATGLQRTGASGALGRAHRCPAAYRTGHGCDIVGGSWHDFYCACPYSDRRRRHCRRRGLPGYGSRG